MNKKYGDIGFCIKSEKDCKLKKCFRHICHNSNPLNITFADFEDAYEYDDYIYDYYF